MPTSRAYAEYLPQIKEKKKGLMLLKEQLKALKMDTAVSTRFLGKDLTALNEHDRRLQRTEVRAGRPGLAWWLRAHLGVRVRRVGGGRVGGGEAEAEGGAASEWGEAWRATRTEA